MLACVSNISLPTRHCWGLLDAQLAHGEPRLINTGGFRARAQNIGFVGNVIGGGQSSDFFEKADKGELMVPAGYENNRVTY
jgi:hypothetical protein